MKNITLLLTLVLTFSGFAQQTGEVVIFDNSGYKFHVILNGIKQNAVADGNVRVQGLRAGWYSCKVLANDNTFSLDKNIIAKSDTLITYRITNKKGKFKLRFFSEVPLNTAPAPAATQSVIAYHTEEIPVNNTGVVTPTTTTNTTQSTTTTITTTDQTQTPANTGMDVNLTVSGTDGTHSETISTTTTTTETNDGVSSNTTMGSGEGSVSISMNVDENGANVNIHGTGFEGQEGATMNTQVSGTESVTHSEQTITTTTTTTTTTGGGNWTTTEIESTESSEVDMDMGSDIVDCFVDEEGFQRFLKMMSNESFEDDKTELTTDFVEQKCLSVENIGVLLDQFDFSDNKLTVAKAAYQLCYDNQDYYLLQEKFTFSDDKEELRNFIDAQ